jgi:hypothetical protein
MAPGLALEWALGPFGCAGVVVDVAVVQVTFGMQDGGSLVVADDDGGADVVALVVGALDVVGADVVRRVVGGGGGGAGLCPDSGGSPVTYAGGGKLFSGTPTRSRFITAAHVAVG